MKLEQEPMMWGDTPAKSFDFDRGAASCATTRMGQLDELLGIGLASDQGSQEDRPRRPRTLLIALSSEVSIACSTVALATTATI